MFRWFPHQNDTPRISETDLRDVQYVVSSVSVLPSKSLSCLDFGVENISEIFFDFLHQLSLIGNIVDIKSIVARQFQLRMLFIHT